MDRAARDEQGGVDRAAGIRGLLRRGPFRTLLIAQAVSSLGDWVGTVAFIAAAYGLTGSPTAVGVVLVLRLLPPLLAAPLGGVLADRFDRRRMMVTANLCMAALVALVPFVGIALLYVIAFGSQSFALLFLPARDAAVPDLVPEDSLPIANGLVMGSSYGAIPFAATLFSGLRLLSDRLPEGLPLAGFFAERPLALPFFFDAATFVFAAALIVRVPIPERTTPAPAGAMGGLGEAVAAARRTPGLPGLATGVGVAMFGGGVLFSIGIGYVRGTLGAGDAEFGFLVALWGVGMATGLAVVQLLGRRGEAAIFRIAVATCGGVLIVMALLPFLWLAYVVAIGFGMAFAVAVMLAITLVQRMGGTNVRGRLMGGAHMLFRVALGAGAIGMGWLATAVDDVAFGVAGFELRLDGSQVALAAGGALIVLGALGSRGVSREAPDAADPTSPDGPPGLGPA